jgi:septal ring factor EnvC (AmiA/AmiB activator)
MAVGYHGYVMPEESRLDRIERNIEFLVENQGKHEAQLATNQAQIAALTTNISRLATIAEMQIETSKDHEQRMADFDRRLAESAAQHDREMAQVRMTLTEITEKLDALVKFVDDQSRHRPNGQQ